MAKKKKPREPLVCLRCGNEIPYTPWKDFTICHYCGQRNPEKTEHSPSGEIGISRKSNGAESSTARKGV